MNTARSWRATVGGTALALAAAVGIVHGSHVPVALDPGTRAVVRIAFSARPERIEVCRTLSDSERMALPAHMRQETSCEGRTAHYHLEVRRDGQMISADLLRGGGLRSDRQLYVFHEVAIPSGPSEIEVLLVRADSAPPHADATSREDVEDRAGDEARADERERAAQDPMRLRRQAGEVPPRLELRARVTLAPREVVLVTYDAESRRLLAVQDPPPP
jgi:hypothetical protein